jgi:uncharacterized protein YutE (UPF0331/DUF86 family)
LTARGGEGQSGVPSRDDLLQLPVEVRSRLRDIPRHLRALQSLLASTDEERYANGARSSDPDVLTRDVYPLERAFEIISNYVAELAKAAVSFAGLAPQDTVQNLRRLASEGAIARSRADRLIDVHRARNYLAHQYPDVRARVVMQAAATLESEVGPFLRDFTRWFSARLDAHR